jgi:hypothetical protein
VFSTRYLPVRIKWTSTENKMEIPITIYACNLEILFLSFLFFMYESRVMNPNGYLIEV